jgi:hypothetical protein
MLSKKAEQIVTNSKLKVGVMRLLFFKFIVAASSDTVHLETECKGGQICQMDIDKGNEDYTYLRDHSGRVDQPVLLNVYGAPELIPKNEFRQPM